MTNQANPSDNPSPKGGDPGAMSKAILWVVLLACVGIIGFVATRLSDIQRDPELDFNLSKLSSDDHAARMKGLEVLNLIALERASGVAPRKIERALPALNLALSDPSEEIRAGALVVFASIGPLALASTEAIRENLSHEDPRVRALSAMALASIMPDDAQTLAAVLKIAHDDNERAARIGIKAVEKLGERARSASGDLVKLAANAELRGAVEQALKAIDPDALSRLP